MHTLIWYYHDERLPEREEYETALDALQAIRDGIGPNVRRVAFIPEDIAMTLWYSPER